MSDMPERIYADPKTGQWFAHQSGCNYVRADAHDTLKAENEEQRERLIQFANAFDAGYAAAERALAERAGGVKVPIGYALVPVEPTDRMVSAYVAAKPKGAGFNHPRKGDDKKAWFAAHEKKCRERWKAMLSVSALTTEPAAPEGRQEAVAWQHIPGCGTDRESKMVSVSEGVFCDPCIAPLVAALNTAGIETVASCCGHGHRPGVIALRDGRELFIAKDFNEARQIDAIFPIDINGNTRPSEQAVTDAMIARASAEYQAIFGKYLLSSHARRILKAAMEAGR